MRPLLGVALAAQLFSCATSSEAQAARKPPPQREPARLEVDLREAPRHLVHARLTLPVEAGPLALAYPKWIPGEHGPNGPVADLAALQASAGGQPVAWRRDDADMYRFLLEVPRGAAELTLTYDFISPPADEAGFSSGASMTQNLALLSWNQVLLAPEGAAPSSYLFHPSVKLPPGWKWASALSAEARGDDGAQVFATTSMEQLIDSPVLAGSHLFVTALGENRGAPVEIAAAAETDGEAQLSAAQLASLKRLVAEEAALFGARHFDHYTFLLSLSDRVAHFGLEHHQSSDDRLGGRALADPELSLEAMGLFGHESVHSWNGKFRRPAGLATPDYQTPMRGDLLWIYEGLTQYLGVVLTARAGFLDPAQAREEFARAAQIMRETRGRATKPLADTAVEAQLLYGARTDWELLRRGVDFYLEGQLLWLEADVRIREQTGGKKSLDDFAALFFGRGDSGPRVVPYQLKEVIDALNTVSPGDWAGFFEARIQRTSDDAPQEGLTGAGWKLALAPEPGPVWKSIEKTHKILDLRQSIGLLLDAERWTIHDLVPGSAADKAGLAPGMKLIAVNARNFSPERLVAAIDETKAKDGRPGAPLSLLVESADSYATATLDYQQGNGWPTLERIEGRASRQAVRSTAADPLSPHPRIWLI